MSRRPVYKPVDVVWVTDKIQNKLGADQVGKIRLRDYIEEIQYIICNYINRNYVPEPLKFVVVNMTMDLLKSEALTGNIDNEKLAEAGMGTVSSVKDGDSEIKFATTNTLTGAHVADVDSLIFNYKIQLDKYRLLKW